MQVRITPDDVGRRVTVRARWHGPEAAVTDVVGTLDEWHDGLLHITDRRGRRHTVAEADLVAGRVVPPPRPRPRRS
jgi:hypothetical protein